MWFNPSNRMYVNDEWRLRLGQVAENTAWYHGNSDELNEFYRESMVGYFTSNSIYTQNRMQYFWARSQESIAYKKVHDSVGSDVVDVLVNVVGTPTVVDGEKELAEKLVKETGLWRLVNQRQLPLSLVQGTGVFKVSNDPLLPYPVLDYYTADRVRYHTRGGALVGIDFLDWYQDEKKNEKYVLEEKRRLIPSGETGSADLSVEYHLYRWNGWFAEDNQEVPLSQLEDTEGLRSVVLKNAGRLYARPTTILMDKRGGPYGRSIFDGKLDLLDLVDEAWSMEARVIRKSAPVTYISDSLLEKYVENVRTENGYESVLKTRAPSDFDRDYVQTADDAIPDGEGRVKSGGIITDQPKLEVDNYDRTRRRAVVQILNGILSSATLGVTLDINVNAPNESREREKITTLTRNVIVAKEKEILDGVLTDLMDMADYKHEGVLVASLENRCGVRFDEFANPSLENELRVLGPAWSAGQISTELYVNNLWRDRLSDAEKEAEKGRLEEQRKLSMVAPMLYEAKNTDADLEEILGVMGQGQGVVAGEANEIASKGATASKEEIARRERLRNGAKGDVAKADSIAKAVDPKDERGRVADGGNGIRGRDKEPRKNAGVVDQATRGGA